MNESPNPVKSEMSSINKQSEMTSINKQSEMSSLNESGNPNPRRIFYYDVLRAIAIMGIVFCHVSVFFVSRDINSPSLYLSAFFDCFREFSIPVFVMLSGALLIGKKDSLQKFFKKRLSRIFIPFLFWVLIYIIYTSFHVYHGFNLSNALGILFGEAGTIGVHLWFVWMIVIAYIGIFIINKIIQMASAKSNDFEKKFIAILAGISAIYIGICYFTSFNPYNDKLIYYISFLSYIIIGCFLAKSDFLEKRINRKYLIIITGLLFIGTYLWYIFCFVVPRSHSAHVFVSYGYFNLTILFMSANLFLLFKYLSKTRQFKEMENKRLGNGFTVISNYSYGIYLVHYLVLYDLKVNLIKVVNFSQGNSLLWIVILVILTTAISLIILSILDKIPYLDKVTGKK